MDIFDVPSVLVCIVWPRHPIQIARLVELRCVQLEVGQLIRDGT